MGCPGENELVEFVEGLLLPKARRQLEVHLDGCPMCRRVVVNLVQEIYPGSLSRDSREDGSARTRD